MENKPNQIRENLLQVPNAEPDAGIEMSAKEDSTFTDYTAQMTAQPLEPAAPVLDLDYEKMKVVSNDYQIAADKINQIAEKLREGEPPKAVQYEIQMMSEKARQEIADLVTKQREATYNQVVQPSQFDFESKLREGIRQSTPEINHMKVPTEFSDFVEKHNQEETTDTTHLEMHPKPKDSHTTFAVLTGLHARSQFIQKIYKITTSGHSKTTPIEMKKIGDDILVNESFPAQASHQQMCPTDKGLLFSVAEGGKNRKGPFKIILKQFEYQSETISCVNNENDFMVGSDKDMLRHVYIFQPKDATQLLKAEKFRYLLVWTFNNSNYVRVYKLGRRVTLLYECKSALSDKNEPIVMFETKKIDEIDNDFLFWKDQKDQMVVIQVNHAHLTHHECKDDQKRQLVKRLNKETEHLTTINQDDPQEKSHISVESGEKPAQHFKRDFSQSAHGKFVQSLLFKYVAIELQQPIAAVLREESILLIDQLKGIIYNIHLHFGVCADELASGLIELFPLEYLCREEAQIVTTHYKNIAISQEDALNQWYVHVHIASINQWRSMLLPQQYGPTFKTVLQPFLKNTYQQVWYTDEIQHNIPCYHLCYRGGIIGAFDKIEKRPYGFVTEAHKDDIICIVSEDPDGIGGEPPILRAGDKKDLKQSLLVEFPKHQKASSSCKEPVPCLAVHTKQTGILTNTDGYKDTEIGQVEGLTMVMLGKDDDDKAKVIAQHPIPLRHSHKLPGLQKFTQRSHYQWDFCRFSEWTKFQKNGKWMNQVDLAFCEYTEGQQMIEVSILRFESEGKKHQNPKFYTLGTKLACFVEDLENQEGNIRKDRSGAIFELIPNFDQSNKIVNCQIKRQQEGEESAVFYIFREPDEKNTIFHNQFTNQTYTLMGPYGNPKVLLVEVEFTSLIQQEQEIFSERQKRDLLRSLVAVILDMVPNQWPQDTMLQTRYVSNYECMQGRKPFQFVVLSPIRFKEALADKSGHLTLIEKLCEDNSGLNEILESSYPIFSSYPLLKRNMDGQTMLKTFYLREDNMMIDVLAKVLLDCPEKWAARDVVMSDLQTMFESEKSLSSFLKFFQNEGGDDHDDTEILIVDSPVKLQMCDDTVEFLTTGSEEQKLDVVDTTKRNSSLSQREIFQQYCRKYDDEKESGKYPISPVMIDFAATEQTIVVDSILTGYHSGRIDDYQVAIWIEKLINKFPQAIDTFKFPKEWIEVKFDTIRWIYYFQILVYMFFMRCLYKLTIHDSEIKDGGEQEYFLFLYLRLAMVVIYTLVILVQEAVQLADAGLDYFTDLANVTETLQVVLNSIFLYQKFTHTNPASSGVSQDLVLGLACLGMTKFLTNLRVFNQLGMLVLLIFQCVTDTVPFIIYLGVWLVFFVCLNEIMGAKSGERLSGLDANLSNYINMFRTTFGDIMEPIYECPEGEDCTVTYLKLWLVFVIMVYFMTIILNNFLIAKVSSIYENFQQSAILTRSKNQIFLITEYLMFQQFLIKCGVAKDNAYDLILMLQRVEGPSEESDLWEGTTKTLMRHVTKQTRDLGSSISGKVATREEVQEMIGAEIEAAKKEIRDVKQDMKNDMDGVKEDISMGFNDMREMLKKD